MAPGGVGQFKAGDADMVLDSGADHNVYVNQGGIVIDYGTGNQMGRLKPINRRGVLVPIRPRLPLVKARI